MNENITTATGTRRANRTTTTRKGKSRTFIAFGLAALAVGGVGAAATSAAWTDNVLFSAQAQAATFDLKGSVDGGKNWYDSSTAEELKLVIDEKALANLLPGETRKIELQVENLGSVSAATVSSTEFVKSTFGTNPTATVDGLLDIIPAGGSDAFTLVVTAPEKWDATANQGKSAQILVTVNGTAVAG